VTRRGGKKKKAHRGNPQGARWTEKQQAAMVARCRDTARMLCESEGLELVHIEYQRESAGRVLRVYIDKPGGVMLADCVNISRQLGDLLDVQEDIDVAYSLEVSSPGDRRPLGKPEDFERFKGRRAEIRTRHPIRNRRTFKGVLLGLVGDSVMLLSDGAELAIPHQEISRARLAKTIGENGCLSQT